MNQLQYNTIIACAHLVDIFEDTEVTYFEKYIEHDDHGNLIEIVYENEVGDLHVVDKDNSLVISLMGNKDVTEPLISYLFGTY